jgi:carboxylesterase
MQTSKIDILSFMPALFATGLTVCLAGCTPIEYEDHWMDSPATEDPSLSDSSFLVSTRITSPSAQDLATPVIIAAHGFGASTYEMIELKDYAEPQGVYVSVVLLGGHGRSIEEWGLTDEEEWGASIIEEYRALDALGYTNISVATTSTGGTLLLRSIHQGDLDSLVAPKHLLFLSPFIVSLDDRLYLAPLIGPILNNVPSNNNEMEKEMYYTNRPQVVFTPLMNLLNGVTNSLDNEGISLPSGTRAHVWHADEDGIVSEESVTKMENGIQSDEPIGVTIVDTDLHPFTRGMGRARTASEAAPTEEGVEPRIWDEEDDDRQEETFSQMIEMVLESE